MGALDDLYAELPEIDCSGRCWDSCGPIDMTKLERRRIAREGGVDIPKGSFLADGPSLCPALTMFGRCGVYGIRPLICRLWGLTEGLPCTYGCRPDRVVTDAEAYELLARAYDISGEPDWARMVRAANDPAKREALRRAWEQVETLSWARTLRDGGRW